MEIETLNQISHSIQIIKNFPKPGIVFRNINTLMKNKSLFNKSIKYLGLIVKSLGIKIDYVVGIESRGFLFSQLANELDCGFVMMRKPGKLPTKKIVFYSKEYGQDSLTIEDDIIEPNSNILIVDDLIASGGTLNAGVELIKLIGSNIIGVVGLIQLINIELNKKLIESNIPILSLLKYQVDSLSNELDFTINTYLHDFILSKSSNSTDKLFIKEFFPLEIKPEYNNYADTIVFYHPNLETLAENYISNNIGCRKGTIKWDKFNDSQPNIKFESQNQLENKKIVFFMSLYDTSELFAQLSMIKVLPRQFIKSLDIYICYYSVGTMERVDEEGTLATADTMANIISSCMETCKEGKPTIHIYDIHTLQNRFYFDYNKIQIKLHSGIPLLKEKINLDSIIVFPDDGSYKRFGKDFKSFKIIVCSKIRDGNKRTITIKDKINFPYPYPFNDSEIDWSKNEVIIIDDLVQSGGTLIECKKALELYGYNKISAYVTHSIFPNDSWNKIICSGFYKFYTTNSVPEVTTKLEKLVDSPFIILKLFGETEYKQKIIYIASHNNQKLQAAWNNYVKIYKNTKIIVRGVNVESNIPNQPIGLEETKQGSFNRLNNMKKYLKINNIKYDYLYSYENGIELNSNNYRDFCCFSYQEYGINDVILLFGISTENVLIPKKYFDKCIESKQQKTIGEIIQEEIGIPKDSFHEFFNIDKYNRIDIMSKIVLEQIKF